MSIPLIEKSVCIPLYKKKILQQFFILLTKSHPFSFITTFIAQPTGLWPSFCDHKLFYESEVISRFVCQFLHNESGFIVFLEERFILCLFFSILISLQHSQNVDFDHLGSTHRTVWGMTCLLETDLSPGIRIIIKICNLGFYSLNCVPPRKKGILMSYPQYLRIWLYLS